MANSNMTKRALASSLRELMSEKTFEKISIGEICDLCGMSRKSFYYHFKDKWDLVNWIFDTEYESKMIGTYTSGISYLYALCLFLQNDKVFYKKALAIKGDNSFVFHFKQALDPIVRDYFTPISQDKEENDYQIEFITDAVITAIIKWINISSEEIDAKKFVTRVVDCLKYITDRYSEFENGYEELSWAPNQDN